MRITLITCALASASAFVLPSAAPRPVARAARAAPATMVSIPRITLPTAVTDSMKDFDLKNPNAMSDAEYDAYSGAAIGGTLIFFLLGATIFNVTGAIYCFLFAALNGGGLCAALALSDTPASEPVNSFGKKVLETAGGISVPRLALPPAVAEGMIGAGLKDPNAMTTAEYDAYSGAAIGGTLIFFLVPGAVFIDVTGAVADFVFSALTGGGICAALALSNTPASEPLNKFGASVLSAVDTVGEKLK
tara:strand:- start:224 stop:964 length:741 start_codon:yes stop_codon:yes gene_type:complete